MTFTEAQARERFDAVLDQAATNGPVRVRREDGREFLITPVPATPADNAAPAPRLNLRDLAGTWVEDAAFDQALAGQDHADPDLWK